ncbi:Rap/Ran GTPase activating protein [Entamoeba marina]
MSKPKSSELEKKIKKHKQLLSDGKGDPFSKTKSILFFIENDRKDELKNYFKQNKSVLHGLFSLYPATPDGLNRKQKVLNEKDATVLALLIEFASELYSPSEITFVQPINLILQTLLAVETPFLMRKEVFISFLKLIVNLNAVEEPYPQIFIASLNLECFSTNIKLGLLCQHLPLNTPTPAYSEPNDITNMNPKQQTFALLDIFFKSCIEHMDILYVLFKEVLSYVFPDYAKSVFLDSYKQNVGFVKKSIPSDLLDFFTKSIINPTFIKAVIPHHETLMELIMAMYDICLEFDVIDHQMITRTISSCIHQFIEDTTIFSLLNIEQEKKATFQKEFILKLSHLFIKNKDNDEPETRILLQNLIKIVLECLNKEDQFSLELRNAFVTMIADGVVGFLPETDGPQTYHLTTMVVDCLFVVWMCWNRTDSSSWSDLHKRLKPYFKSEYVVGEIERKFNHITLELVENYNTSQLNDSYSIPEQLQTMKLTDVELVSYHQKEPSITLPLKDSSLQDIKQSFTIEELMFFWNIMNWMFQDLSRLSEEAVDNCTKVITTTLTYLLSVDDSGKVLEDYLQQGRIQLYDIYLPYLIKSLKNNQQIGYRNLCKLMIRELPKTTPEVYSYFYKVIMDVQTDNQKIIEEVLVGCSQIFTVGLPGAEILIPTFF